MNISAKIVIWIENINNALKTFKRADNFKKLRGDKTFCNVAIDTSPSYAFMGKLECFDNFFEDNNF